MMTKNSKLPQAHQSVSLYSNPRKLTVYLVLPLLLALSFLIHSQSQAAESQDTKPKGKGYAGIYKHQLNGSFSVRGWRLSSHVYFGQTKTFGNTGYGLLVDKGDYAYGLINESVSFLKSF
jgi:hypothetical protein